MSACIICASSEARTWGDAPLGIAAVPLCSAECAALAARLVQGKRGAREDEDAPQPQEAPAARAAGDTPERDAAALGGALFDRWNALPTDLRDEILGKLPVLEAVRRLRALPGAPVWTELYARFADHFGLAPRPPTTDARSALLAVMRLYDYLIYRRTPTGLEPAGLVPLRSRSAVLQLGRDYLTTFRAEITEERITLRNAPAFVDARGSLWGAWQELKPGDNLAQQPVRAILRRLRLLRVINPWLAPRYHVYEFDENGTPPSGTDATYARRAGQPVTLDALPGDGPNVLVSDEFTNPDVVLMPLRAKLWCVVWLSWPGAVALNDRYATPFMLDVIQFSLALGANEESRLIQVGRGLRVRSARFSIYQPREQVPTRFVPSSGPNSSNTYATPAALAAVLEAEPWYRGTYLSDNAQNVAGDVLLDLDFNLGIASAEVAANRWFREQLHVSLVLALIRAPAVTGAARCVLQRGETVLEPMETWGTPERPAAAPIPPDARGIGVELRYAIPLGGDQTAHVRRLHLPPDLPALVPGLQANYRVARLAPTLLAGDATLGFAFVERVAQSLWWVPAVAPERSDPPMRQAIIVRGETPIAAATPPAARAP